MQIRTPDWVKHAVIYQIFPDRFARATSPVARISTQSISLESWDAPPTLQGYKGGNLWGVIHKLDYLQDLGIDAIYLTPIFQSACNHRYHTHDYYRVDPLLGGDEAFLELLDAAHQRQIKIILDGVFNHASRGFYFFNDILENGPYSPWLDWFRVMKWPVCAYDGDRPANYASWAGNRALPQFNHDNPDVREYIMQVGEYWVKQGIDGWRLDVPYEVKTPGFWQEFRDRIKMIDPEAYIVGEVWREADEWLDGTQFDGVMNYLFTEATIAFAAGDRVDTKLVEEPEYYPYPALDAKEYAEKIQSLLDRYPWEIQLTQLNLLDSHDTARMLSVAGGDRASLELATLLMMAFPGAPCIYYGNEVGLSGTLDPDSRRVFPTEDHWDRPLLDLHRQLIDLRRRYPVLCTGDYRILFAQDHTYAFARTSAEQTCIVAVNAGTKSVKVRIDASHLPTQPNRRLFGPGEASWDGDELELIQPERSGCILG